MKKVKINAVVPKKTYRTKRQTKGRRMSEKDKQSPKLHEDKDVIKMEGK